MKYEPNKTNLPLYITVENYPSIELCAQYGWHFGSPIEKKVKYTTGVFHIKYKNQ